MNYKKMFDPDADAKVTYRRGGPDQRVADRPKARSVYEYTPEIVLHVNLALATGRPLLVRGPSGSGKSSLARAVAERLGWRFYAAVVTSRTQGKDLLWSFDSIRRLSDAQAGGEALADRAEYVEPGPLWWAFDRASALQRGTGGDLPPQRRPKEPVAAEVAENSPAVVLIDEIDKADPDMPNSLLVALGSLWFRVEDTGALVRAPAEAPPLVVITTNDERELPAAFLRRCVVLTLAPADEKRLVRIAKAHFGAKGEALYQTLARPIADAAKHAAEAGASGLTEPAAVPSTAEFLDAVWSCIDLGLKPPPIDGKAKLSEADAELWKVVERAMLAKKTDPVA